ncbi:ribonuclease H [Trifolium pratense]|uniref:Ribonuclease H n=2 Tax=Trifolium TaxID=3898 RepID=A0A2K3NZW3_TRIPR|nr:ribonuclease H [Trifolium pratense]
MLLPSTFKIIPLPSMAFQRTNLATIIYNTKELLARNRRIRIVHTLRECNVCADFLAKLGARHPEAYSPLVTPPDGMSLLLLADASETLFSR